MCGIAGLLTKHHSGNEVIRGMTNKLLHRGPDQSGFYEDLVNGVYLGHRRLSILDLSDLGKQPMQSEDGRYIISFNGEIYNYLKLKKNLEKRGCVFKSTCDTEVLLVLFTIYGVDCFLRLDGMFAVSIYDKKENKLILCRDRIGEKPLYYINNKNYFAFSSEIKSFESLKTLGYQHQIDRDMTSLFITMPWLPERERTLLNDVYKVEPGYYMEVNLYNRKIIKKKYWELPVNSTCSLNFSDATQKYESLLIESINNRMQSDVPVGVMLSGGLDSSLITSIANRYSSTTLSTYTLIFDDEKDERFHARKVSDYLGTNHHELFVDVNSNIIDMITKYIDVFDDLSSVDGGIISTFLMSQQIKKHGIKVLLFGEGADEVNAGYGKYMFSKAPFNFFPKTIRNFLYYYATSRNLLINNNSISSFQYMLSKLNNLSVDELQEFTGFDILYQLPNNLLMKVDKSTMMASVEARVPFLDHKIVEFAYSLPNQYKIRGKHFSMKESNEKYILREIAAKYLPLESSQRKKMGMMLPTDKLLVNNLNRIKELMMSQPDHLLYSFISQDYVNKLFVRSDFSIINTEKEWLLWKLLVLFIWINHLDLK